MDRYIIQNDILYNGLVDAQPKTALQGRHPIIRLILSIVSSLCLLIIFSPISFLFMCCFPNDLSISIFQLINFPALINLLFT